MKLLLIDGNNLAARAAFANNDLSVVLPSSPSEDLHPDDALSGQEFPTGVMHGFFRSLAMLRQSHPSHYIAIVWDGGNDRRVLVTRKAMTDGILHDFYKANRKRGEVPPELEAFFVQKPEIQRAISLTNIPQVVIKGEEADDVVASYVARYSGECDEILVHTTDKDYYQLLSHNVTLLRADETFSMQEFEEAYGLSPSQWVDVGALMGDSGDNIFGAPGWGEKTAMAAIKLYGSVDGFYKAMHLEFDQLRVEHPDLSGEALQGLLDIKTPKGKVKYSLVGEGTPFTGVAKAMESGKVKKPRSSLSALMFERRVRLAADLKKMVVDIAVPELPGTGASPSWDRGNEDEFLSFCSRYSLSQVAEDAELLCSLNPCRSVTVSL